LSAGPIVGISVALKIWLQVSDASVAWSINLLEEERRLSSGLVSATLSGFLMFRHLLPALPQLLSGSNKVQYCHSVL
jgi:hypothetical protein